MRDLASFVAVSAIVIATPGPDTLVTVRNALAGTRIGGISTALGVATGLATWTVLSAVGTVAVLNAFDGALHLLRIAGAAYLLVLGARTLWYALGTATSSDAPETSAVTLTPQAAFTQGLLSNLSNPKIAIFFGSLLSQFATTLMPLVGLGLLFCAMTLMWLTAYVLVVDTATFLRGPFARRTIEIIGGVALVAFGLGFATERV